MQHIWKSNGIYEHPAEHQAGTFGQLVLSLAGIYVLQIGNYVMNCPQNWATKIHAKETNQC